MLEWLFGDQSQTRDRMAALAPPTQAVDDDGRTSATGRRDRALDGGGQQLRDGIAQKVLHGWLQNRHQTLYPLTVNLRSLSVSERAALANWIAITLKAGHVPGEARVREIDKWLGSVGADAATLAAFTVALSRPLALHESIASIIEHGLGPYAYVMALVALDPADPATLPFLDYVAIRFSLPTTVVRSATRRYRR